ncbi:hypothetical protein [Streptomyces sp. CAU 1734]|uniref:hypothetical protein n=1 Tax=Streptomyces sp. CAU 1734 TaxID=3140360 RepID=UPI00326058FF
MRTPPTAIAPEPQSGLPRLGRTEERITVRALPAGPLTDYTAVCSVHGDVGLPNEQEEAIFRRKAHIVEAHTARPLPLGRSASAQALPPVVLGHLRAATELRRLSLSDPTETLLQLVVELLADTRPDA